MSKRYKAPSMSRRLLYLGAVPSIVMFVALMGFFTSARLDDAQRDLSDTHQLLADSLAPSLEYTVVSGNTSALQDILSGSVRSSKANWIRVIDVAGEQVGMASAGGATPAPKADGFQVYEAEILQKPVTLGDHNQKTLWFQPEQGMGQGVLRVGMVQVGVSNSVLDERRNEIFWSSVAMGLFLLVCTIVVIKYTLKPVLSPIKAVSGRIGRLIEGDYQVNTVNQRGNTREIIAIEQQLNELAQHLENLRASRDQTLAVSEQARDKAESASNAKSDFLATMSQELRIPLTGVLAMIDQTEQEPLSQEQQQHLQTARQSTEDLLTVISDILDYASLDSDGLIREYQPFNLRTLITNCVASYRHVAEKHKLTLRLQFYGDWPEVPLVSGDGPRIRQIIAFLIDNAIKFTSNEMVSVEVGCLGVDDNGLWLRCAISDSGSGLAHEQVTDVVSNEEQSASDETHRTYNSGMGLSLVQRLVELLGGRVQVDTGPGKSASFCFELPLKHVSQKDSV